MPNPTGGSGLGASVEDAAGRGVPLEPVLAALELTASLHGTDAANESQGVVYEF
jgi:hypothetical protein